MSKSETTKKAVTADKQESTQKTSAASAKEATAASAKKSSAASIKEDAAASAKKSTKATTSTKKTAKNTSDTAKSTSDTAKNASDTTRNASNTAKNTSDATKDTSSTTKNLPATAKKVTPANPTSARQTSNSHAFNVGVIACLIISILVASAGLGLSIYNFLSPSAQLSLPEYGTNGNSLIYTEGSIAEIANRVSPAVVSITTETRTMNWFGQSTTSTAAGTGMIVTADGYVLTNKHVVDGARSISIILDDGTTYTNVKLVGSDPLNDVAFLKIENAQDLPTVTLGTSVNLTTGQQVIAIGNALGQYQNTVTAGVISGIGRSLTASTSDSSEVETLQDMIQTDAAINPGNSGGPLVNAAGEVIGINTATTTDAEGLGFAIPITGVKGMLKSIINTGKAERAYLGLYSVNLTPYIAKQNDIPVSTGAYVSASSALSPVIAGTPAEKAGFKTGDIITKVNGVEIGHAGSLSTLIGEYAPGDTIQLTYIRDGAYKTVNVTLAAFSS